VPKSRKTDGFIKVMQKSRNRTQKRTIYMICLIFLSINKERAAKPFVKIVLQHPLSILQFAGNPCLLEIAAGLKVI